ncbi:Fe(3+) dicitrate transport system permease protein FecD [Paenibacillus solanacearum]|uniref:Fe(3+) dicitrate transport system permease protein FecD n=1 Tax=Paenibacillus solanacearum TaxID=2048548 RepID=A0A916K9L5_9BACL|nr:iron chelate uptake ABC transporter family permease subunit [Paenibacillus solanacearum]CAG7648600.1 Fe(3+) dicitrate transport system permease protein FecD [Paenibacillus solanacearum]
MSKGLVLITALFTLLVLSVVSVSAGTVPIPLRSMGESLWNPDSPTYYIVHEVRLPRVVVGILAGFGLAAGGVILQSLIRNPLASPDVIGITKGAGLVAAAVIFLFPKAPGYMLPAAALAGALAAFALLLLLSKRLTLSPAALALVGVAIGAVLQAGTQYLIVTHPTNINTVLLWLSGSLWGRGWREALSLLPWIALLLPAAWLSSGKLNVFLLGDETSISLGLDTIRQRFWLLLLAVALAGISVAAVGAIGFVGLIAPHMARSLIGSRNQWLIPLSALIGANLMLLGDCIGRIVITPREVPVGIMTAIIGAPYFVYLLRRERLRRIK